MNKISRRSFLQWSGLAAAGSAFSELAPDSRGYVQGASDEPLSHRLDEATIADLQKAMEAETLTSHDLVRSYLARIRASNEQGPHLRAVLEVNPEALTIARALDEERRQKGPRGPLHGIPILLKDNIDTADQMQTTAGSFALVGSRPVEDSTLAARLRAAGAVILGKANLSEWANFRSSRSSSGWSGRGRQARNPYVLDRNPCGSSSGSASAVSANLTAVSLGTETDGSIVCPSSICGVVGIKPTVGLTSRAGVIPISHTQDTVGPHGRTVADAATVLGALTGVDPRDPATQESEDRSYRDYTQFLIANGLQGSRIGVARQFHSGYSEHTDAIFDQAVDIMRQSGAKIIENVVIPSEAALRSSGNELTVLLYEFKAGIKAYLDMRPDAKVHDLADLIQFNRDHADVEMPYFRQEIFELAQARGPLTDPAYLDALAANRAFADGFRQFMEENNYDALVAPTALPAWTTDVVNGDRFLGASSGPAAVSGFPLVTVPAGYAFEHLPVGITFMGPDWSEPTLIKLAYAFESVTRARRRPRFLRTLPTP